ncbi:hypothetical protein [Streptomyces canus]|uniref:hypothetical protein n=1 Tax=Streptomyces canus TaxID=58343 RepID=UPI003F4D0744
MRKLSRPDGPGSGVVDKPVRLSALVSSRGERRALGGNEVRALVRAAVDSSRGEPPFPAYGPDRLAPLERLFLGGLGTNHTGLRRRP